MCQARAQSGFQSLAESKSQPVAGCVIQARAASIVQARAGQHLGQVALSKAVESSLLGNSPFQGDLDHTKHIWQCVLQQADISLSHASDRVLGRAGTTALMQSKRAEDA